MTPEARVAAPKQHTIIIVWTDIGDLSGERA